MSGSLTFADRENLLASIRNLSGENVDVEDLLRETGRWARGVAPKYGFERALLRNVTQLSNYLRLHQDSEDIASIARGAIQFVVDKPSGPEEREISGDNCDDGIQEFHALGKAFIASYAVHEIAIRLGESIAYHPPSISKAEQSRAEEIFEELSKADGCDVELVDRVFENLEQIKNLTECGFLRRFASNARTLVDVLQDPQRPEDDLMCARGALRYFVEENDAISDDLGLVGYLDDLFILQTAVDLVSPLREPLIELLDKVTGAWPFLNMLTLDDGSGPRAASEFMILNSALSCPNLRSIEAHNTMLIAPETGPIAILLGFISALGMAHDAGARDRTEASFTLGQKVLVDYEAVAFFEGVYESNDGRRFFRLRKDRTERGQSGLGLITSWPIGDLWRLVPIDGHRSVRGEIEYSKRNKTTSIGGLGLLFNGPNNADVHGVKKVIVVMPTTIASEFCKSTLLFGQPIKDVIPIGQVATDGEDTVSWSSRFGSQKPVLLFASDLDIARIYAEEHREEIELIVIDMAGRNQEKHASLKRLDRLKIPYLLVATERIANETAVDQQENLNVWEWESDDLKSLVWQGFQAGSDAGGIAKYELRVRSASSARLSVEPISLPIVNNSYNSFLALRRMAKRHGTDGLPELDDIVSQAFFALSQLMCCATELKDESACVLEVRKHVAKIKALNEGSNFISVSERDAITQLVEQIGELLVQLKSHNPKAARLSSVLARYPGATVFCPNARLITELQSALVSSTSRVLAAISNVEDHSNGLIVTGWFRQSRMALVLSPPIADPVVLLMYGVEQHWYKSFSENRRKMREERRRLKGRAEIFPAMKGWKQLRPVMQPSVDVNPDLDDIELVRADIDEGFLQRVYAKLHSEQSNADAKARLVVFSGGAYGLFTDNYKLNVVTHLLNGTLESDEENSSVKLAAAKSVGVGDAIVFRPRSRDLIRDVADELLEPGQRQRSGLWRKALRRYVCESGLSTEAICEQLRDAGCKSQNQAIQNWINDDDMIAPLQYRADVPAIAQVTGDPELTNEIDAVIKAIKDVRSAHQHKAPQLIAKRIRKKAAIVARREQDTQSVVHLDDGLVLVRVMQPASELIPVNYSSANRLIEGDEWHE